MIIMDFAVPMNHREKFKKKQKDRYLDLASKLKKIVELSLKGLGKRLEELEISGKIETIRPQHC